MRHVTRTFLAVLCAAALVLGGCSDDGPDATGDDGAGGVEERPPGPPEEAPDLTGPVLDLSTHEVATRCPAPGPSDHYPTTTRNPLTCLPKGEDDLGLVMVADEQSDHDRNGVFVRIEIRTDILIGDGAGGWRPGEMRELAEGGEVQIWSREDDPLEHTSNETLHPETITYVPPAAPPPPPTRPLPWNPQVSGSVAAFGPCPSADAAAVCGDGVVATVLVQGSRDGSDLLAGVTAETTVLVHDGAAWVAGSLDQVRPGAPIRVWTSDYRLMKTPPNEGLAKVVAVGPVDLW